MSENENKKNNERNMNSAPERSLPFGNGGAVGRFPRSLIVWLLIFLLAGAAIWMRYSGSVSMELDQTQFEQRLTAGDVLTASVRPEPDGVLDISGKIRLNAADIASLKRAEGVAEGDYGNYNSRVLKSERIDTLLQSHVPSFKVEEPSTIGNLLWMLLPTLLFLGLFYLLISRQYKMAGNGAMQFGKSRARMIPPDELNVSFDDVAGADEAKVEITEIVDFLKDPLKFKLLGGKLPKGCLLTGPPGTGKTLLAKAVACEAHVPFFSISGSDFMEMFVGVGASRVRDMFEQARRCSPCLIFIDEIDAVGRSRFSGLGGGHDEREQTLNAMLVEMDGLESSRSNVIVLAATNRPDVLDPALLRPGRFDRQIVMPLPDIAGRRKILEVHAGKIKLAQGVDLEVVAKGTPGFSGADLANLCNEAALLAARKDAEEITQKDLEEARDKVCWGSERRSHKMNEHDRKLTAYHEAGHALVALYTEHSDDVHKVTIVPRGQALGLTCLLPEGDSDSLSRGEMLDDMAMTMGGRAAEELAMDDISSGAAMDLKQATRYARLLVCTFGMDPEIGPVQYADPTAPHHSRLDGPVPDSMGPETARELDLAIKRYLDQALTRARTILSEHRDQLEKLAQALLEKETMSGGEINELFGWVDGPPKGRQIKSAVDPKMDSDAVAQCGGENTAAVGPETEVPAPAEVAEPSVSVLPENHVQF